MTLTAEQKAKLRNAAEVATPGQWCTDDYHGVIADAGLNGNYYIASCSGPEHRQNKRFIALANPETIKALLDELESKDKQLASGFTDEALAQEERAERAEQHIAELEAVSELFMRAKALMYQSGGAPIENSLNPIDAWLYDAERAAAGIAVKVGE